MAGRSHKPTYWGSPLDEERKAAARAVGLLGRVGGLLGLAMGSGWADAVEAWCGAEEKRRRDLATEGTESTELKRENQEKTDEREADFDERGDGAGDSGGAEDDDAAGG